MTKWTPRNRERIEDENRVLGTLLVWTGIATVGVPSFMVGSQILTWLRDGYWPKLSTGDLVVQSGLTYPITDWVGVQKLIDWIMSWPASLMIFLSLGFVVYLISIPTSLRQAEMMRFHNHDLHSMKNEEDKLD